jgi:hypothetical protein
VDGLHVDRIASCLGGVFAVPGTPAVCGLWASFSYSGSDGGAREMSLGVPVHVVAELVRQARAAAAAASAAPLALSLLDLGAELKTVPLSKARQGLGLPSEWVQRLERDGDDRRQVLSVRRCTPRTSAAGCLREGDMLLAVNGSLASNFAAVEAEVQAALAQTPGVCADGSGGATCRQPVAAALAHVVGATAATADYPARWPAAVALGESAGARRPRHRPPGALGWHDATGGARARSGARLPALWRRGRPTLLLPLELRLARAQG